MWPLIKWKSHNQELKHENNNYENYLKSMLKFEKGSKGYSYLYLTKVLFHSWGTYTPEVQRSRYLEKQSFLRSCVLASSYFTWLPVVLKLSYLVKVC